MCPEKNSNKNYFKTFKEKNFKILLKYTLFISGKGYALQIYKSIGISIWFLTFSSFDFENLMLKFIWKSKSLRIVKAF